MSNFFSSVSETFKSIMTKIGLTLLSFITWFYRYPKKKVMDFMEVDKPIFFRSLLPGLQQYKNGQAYKTYFFAPVFVLFSLFAISFLASNIGGFITLGETPKIDNSLLLLGSGTLSLIVFAVYLYVYRLLVLDGIRTGMKIKNGEDVSRTFEESKTYLSEQGFVYISLMPAIIFVLFIVIYPVIMTFLVANTNYSATTEVPGNLVDWNWLTNFKRILTEEYWTSAFTQVLKWNLIWAIFAALGGITVGVIVAIVVNQDFIKGKRIFRSIYILPWAVPAFITISVFSQMFLTSGVINTSVIPSINNLIPFVDLPTDIRWKFDADYTKLALILIQTWLGFPFIFLMTTGVLQSISADLYEAAEIDGGTSMQKFKTITLPIVLYATAPILITQFTFNFNNFGIIYLFNNGGPATGSTAGSTDILLSWIFKMTTDGNHVQSMAAAITIFMSLFTMAVAGFSLSRTKQFKDEEGLM